MSEAELPPQNYNILPRKIKTIDEADKLINEMIQRYDEYYRLLRNYVENGLAKVIQQDPDVPGRYGKFDNAHRIPVSIDVQHHEMHEGDHYFFKSYIVDSGGAGSVTVFSFTTPDTATRIHAKAALSPDVDYTVIIHEGATVSDGTPLDGINCDRDSGNVAELTALGGPTVDIAGTDIWSARNGGGKDPIGVAPGFNYEIIAKTNTTYTFTLTKNIAQAGIVDIDFWWYEHAPE